jgi:hypothetical protein
MAIEKLADQITKLMNGSLDSERSLTLQVSEFFQFEFCESLSGKVGNTPTLQIKKYAPYTLLQ